MYKETKCSLCYTELSVWIKAEFCEALFFQMYIYSHAMIPTPGKLQ